MSSINWLGVLAATVASWMFGAVYYGALGKRWMRALGRGEADIEKRVVPVVPMIVSFVAEFVMAATLAGIVYHLAGGAPLRGALISAAMVWLGFTLAPMVVNNAYQSAKLSLSLIDGAHWFGVLMIQALVLGLMG